MLLLSIFLRQGLLCCVCLRPTWNDLSGENIYPPLVFQQALLFNFIWCVCCYPLTTRLAPRGGQAPPSLIKGGHAPPLRSLPPPCRGGQEVMKSTLFCNLEIILTLRKFKSSYRKIKKDN